MANKRRSLASATQTTRISTAELNDDPVRSMQRNDQENVRNGQQKFYRPGRAAEFVNQTAAPNPTVTFNLHDEIASCCEPNC
jgi:hypothetical protein